MADEVAVCGLCEEPLPEGEQMFRYHGYSGPCPVEKDRCKNDDGSSVGCARPVMHSGKHRATEPSRTIEWD